MTHLLAEPILPRRALPACLCALVLVTSLTQAAGQTGLGDVTMEHWGSYQMNVDGAVQWKYEPRVYIPYRFDQGEPAPVRF